MIATGSHEPWKSLLPVAFTLLATLPCAQGLVQTLCSSQNTAGLSANTSIYQSLGYCQGVCQASYAYAIVQGNSCWCSNITPANKVAVSQCDDACLGYPYESCGSVGKRLFGYFALSRQPDPPSPSTTSSTTTPMTSSSLIVDTPVTMKQPQSQTSTTTTPITPITTQQVKTISGSVMTVTATITPSPIIEAQADIPSKKLSSGSVVAIVVSVVIAAIVLLAAVIIGLCCWRRKRSDYDEDESSNIPHRNTSILSRAGLLGKSGSPGAGAGTGSGTISGAGTDINAQQSLRLMQERRNSKMLLTDQRLDPNAFMQHDDGSAISFVSMQDNRDYTRTLNVRNPDAHPD